MRTLQLPVEMLVSTPVLNEVMDMAIFLGLSPIVESNMSMYGKHTFDIENFTSSPKHSLSVKETSLEDKVEAVIERIASLAVVRRPVWSYFWENAKKKIPLSWRNYKLVFGDIFVNHNGTRFLLVFSFKSEWTFSFEKISDLVLLTEKIKFVISTA